MPVIHDGLGIETVRYDDLTFGHVGLPRSPYPLNLLDGIRAQRFTGGRVRNVVVSVLGQGANRDDAGHGSDKLRRKFGPKRLFGVVI
ncbi:hypothetical protein D9M68_739440 [compost metagenome]